jgi:catechol 2,3-dioxygenase-like lactoylglutathione lyase family enzyme
MYHEIVHGFLIRIADRPGTMGESEVRQAGRGERMNLLRAATLSVADLDRSVGHYREWLDYSLVEDGDLDSLLAKAWGAPASAGSRYAVLRPASGSDTFIRFVECEPHPDYVPLVSFGWAAIEICVEDVRAVHQRMLESPFEVIGPPRELDGMAAIFPMQVKGPDSEIVFLTQIREDLPEFDLPRAEAPIDRLFILVLACSDMNASLDWIEESIGFAVGQRNLEIVYTMLARAFGTPPDETHAISTMVDGRNVFLQVDQLPPQAGPRPGFAGRLPQGVALGTFLHPDFDTVDAGCRDLWITPPVVHDSVIYGGRRSATVRAPDGALIEIVEV